MSCNGTGKSAHHWKWDGNLNGGKDTTTGGKEKADASLLGQVHAERTGGAEVSVTVEYG
jgi:hypothetical protein